MIYLDTSALAPLYFPEPTSPTVAAALRARSDHIVTIISIVEIASVASLKLRTGKISEQDAEGGLALFRRHERAGLYRRLPLRIRHYRDAHDRIAHFDQPLRTLDALHLAIAADAGAELMTLDRQLAVAAEAAGLRVVVPK